MRNMNTVIDEDVIDNYTSWSYLQPICDIQIKNDIDLTD